MADHLVGVEFDAVAVRAVEVRRGAVRAVAEVPLPQGAVLHGEIQDPAAVGRAIREAWKQGRFRTRRAVLGIANQFAVVRPVALPPLAPDDLRAALRYELADLVPFPTSESITDAIVLDGVAPEPPHGEHDRAMLAVVVHEPAVAALHAAAKAGRLRVVTADLLPLALVRANGTAGAAPVPDGDGDADPTATTAPAADRWAETAGEALVHVSGDVISIVVHVAGTPRFARIVVDRSTSNAQMTAEIEAALALIETIRQRTTSGDHAVDTIPDAPVRRDPVAEAIRSTLDYFAYQPGAVPIRAIRLSGMPMRLRQLAEPLAASAGIPVSVHDPFAGRWAAAPEDGERFAAAFGLALPEGVEVAGPKLLHLLPPRLAARRRQQRRAGVLVPAGALVLAGVVGSLVVLGPDPGGARARLDAVTDEVLAEQARLAPYQATLDALTSATARTQQREQLLAGTASIGAVVAQLAALAPEGLEVTAVSVPGGPAGTADGATATTPTPASGVGAATTVAIDVTGSGAAVDAYVQALTSAGVLISPTRSVDTGGGPVRIQGALGPAVIGTRTAAGAAAAPGSTVPVPVPAPASGGTTDPADPTTAATTAVTTAATASPPADPTATTTDPGAGG